MKIKKEIIFCFKNYPLLIADENGNFTYNGLPCKKTFVNGTIQIRCSRFKFSKSLIQLRKLAFKKEIIQEQICPF